MGSSVGAGFVCGDTERCKEAFDSAMKSIAKVFGRESEFQTFIAYREKMLAKMNSDVNTDLSIQYEEYRKSIPYWVVALEEPLFKMYLVGVQDGRLGAILPHNDCRKDT